MSEFGSSTTHLRADRRTRQNHSERQRRLLLGMKTRFIQDILKQSDQVRAHKAKEA